MFFFSNYFQFLHIYRLLQYFDSHNEIKKYNLTMHAYMNDKSCDKSMIEKVLSLKNNV